jgi:uncharacterized protein (TIGR03067 family)
MLLRALAPLAVLLLLAADDKKDAKKDQEKLQGTWDVVSLEVAGNTVPKDKLENFRSTIKDDVMSHKGAEEGKTEEVTFVLDPSQKPKAIDMTLKKGGQAGQVILGIYSLDGDNLKLCMNQPGLERPKEFVSKAESRVVLIMLKRAKAK